MSPCLVVGFSWGFSLVFRQLVWLFLESWAKRRGSLWQNRIDPFFFVHFFFIEAVQPQSGHLSRLGGGEEGLPSGVIADAAEWSTVTALHLPSGVSLFLLAQAGLGSSFLLSFFLASSFSLTRFLRLYAIIRRCCCCSSSSSMLPSLPQPRHIVGGMKVLIRTLYYYPPGSPTASMQGRIVVASPSHVPWKPVRAPRLLGLAPLAPRLARPGYALQLTLKTT